MDSRKNQTPEDASEQLRKMTTDMLQKNREVLDDITKHLTKTQRRVLEYFWNEKRQELRYQIPKEVIYFLESEERHAAMMGIVRSDIDLVLLKLQSKGYLESSGGSDVKLSNEGVEYLTRVHPLILLYWEKALKLTPPTVSLLAAFIGFVASVFGIVQFIDWLRHGQ